MKVSSLSPSSRRVLAGFALTAALVCSLQYGSAVLRWASGDPLDFVGHLISGFRAFTLNPLDPAYPRYF